MWLIALERLRAVAGLGTGRATGRSASFRDATVAPPA